MKPRVLHAITVYNGRSFVPAAVESALRMDGTKVDFDVLILDDASPEPGFSHFIEEYCAEVGAKYYCTPRNLGIPRNVNIALLAGMDKGYDYVTINNSDVLFPRNLLTELVSACERDNKIGSITACSNNVSIYTLPNTNPDRYLANQDVVDIVSEALQNVNSGETLDIPAGISFCIMVPTQVIKNVGLMDPVFGRGYCEETDWSLRSLAAGYRLCLGLGAFVYHQGRGSNVAAGLVSGAHTTVPENEEVIDRRYPWFRKSVRDFEDSGAMDQARSKIIRSVIKYAAAALGYRIINQWDPGKNDMDGPYVEICETGVKPHLVYFYAGFSYQEYIDGDPTQQIKASLSDAKLLSNRFDRAAELEILSAKAIFCSYPEEV